jgi:hypothetical protein
MGFAHARFLFFFFRRFFVLGVQQHSLRPKKTPSSSEYSSPFDSIKIFQEMRFPP